MSGTVTLEQLDKIDYVIGPKATCLGTAVIRLHSAENQEKKWVYSGLCGALCFIIDRKLGGVALFKMFDLDSFNSVFEAELYYDFPNFYMEMNDNFYCFPIPGNHYIGFSFADSEEALTFKSLVEKYSPKSAHKNRPEDKTRKFIVPKEVEVKKKQGFFGGLFKKNNQSETDEMEYIDSLKISRPENPTHENHIGWDAKNQNFDFSQLSKELKRVFKKAGIRKKDLKDTNTALLIADAILNQPLPDAKKKNKKVPDKNIKDIEGLTSEIGTPVLTMTRRSSTMSAQMKLLQLPSSANNSDARKNTFQSNMSSMDKKHNLSKQDEISLTSKLASAIAQRRKQLTKHDVESEEDDWSDDDA